MFRRRLSKYESKQQRIGLPPPNYGIRGPACQKILDFHDSNAKIRGMFGGNRAAKSTTGAMEVLLKAWQYPGQEFWVVNLTMDYARISFAKIFDFLPQQAIKNIAWFSRAKRIPAVIELWNGSNIYSKTCSAGYQSLMAAKVKGIWVDEDPDAVTNGYEVFQELLLRTADSGGFLWVTATPLWGENWMFSEIYDKSFRHDDIDAWTVSMMENQFISEEDKQRILSILSPSERKRRIEGQFTTMEGLVFGETFNREKHVIRPIPIPDHFTYLRAFDFGKVDPFCSLISVDAWDRTMYVVSEYYQNNRLMQEHAVEVAKQRQRIALPPDIYIDTIADHDAQLRLEMDNLGYPSRPARKDILYGIELLNRLFYNDRIRIFADCENLIRELGLHRYPDRRGKKVAPSGEKKEYPLDKDNHAIDCLRYEALEFYGDGDYISGGEIFDAPTVDNPVESIERDW